MHFQLSDGIMGMSGRRAFMAGVAGIGVVGLAGCSTVRSDSVTTGEIVVNQLLGEAKREDLSPDENEWRIQHILALHTDGETDLSPTVESEYGVEERDVYQGMKLQDLPLGQLYEDFDRLVCEPRVRLTADDSTNNFSEGDVEAYAAYSDLFNYIEIGTEYRLEVAESRGRYAINRPRIIDLVPVDQ